MMGSGGGSGSDPGKVMGRLFANSPGPRVSPAGATRLGGAVPAGAAVDTARDRLTVTGHTVHLVALASPVGGRDDTFRIAGLVNPTITVSAGARVSIEVVNADPDTSHGLAVSAPGAGSGRMPMMTAASAFVGSAVWLLGDPTTAGMHTGTLTFTATTPAPTNTCAPPRATPAKAWSECSSSPPDPSRPPVAPSDCSRGVLDAAHLALSASGWRAVTRFLTSVARWCSARPAACGQPDRPGRPGGPPGRQR